MMSWQVSLIGEPVDVSAIAAVAHQLVSEIGKDREGGPVLRTPSFSSLADPAEIMKEAIRILSLLNGLAHLQHADHTNVSIGDAVIFERIDGSRDVNIFVAGETVKARAGVVSGRVETSDRNIEGFDSKKMGFARGKIIISCEILTDLIKIIALQKSWQKIRIIDEKLRILLCGDHRKSKCLRDMKYINNDEFDRLVASMHEPGLSGFDALHAYRQRSEFPEKMDLDEAYAIMRRCINKVIEDQMQQYR